MTELVVADLTQATLEGSGVFDVLMRANKAHLEAEFNKNRIKGPEYATVYLGSLNTVMNTALQFLMSKEKLALEALLLQQQIALAEIMVLKANIELQILEASLLKVPAEIELIEAQTALAEQQKANLIDSLETDALQRLKLTQETENLVTQDLHLQAQTDQVEQQTLNLASQKAQIEQQTSLAAQQTTNAATENTVLQAQKCKLDAEFDLLKSSTLKSAQEIALLSQKIATERAQTTELGVDLNSVLGRQKELYLAQTLGFTRDAEQKVAKVLVDSWNVRRTTDEATVADGTNMLNDVAVGRAVNKLLSGVGA